MTLRFGFCFLLLLGACGKPPDEGWLGYGEGDSAMISAPQPGWVTELKVERGQVVRPGDLLFVLDSTQQQASIVANSCGLPLPSHQPANAASIGKRAR